MARFDFNADEIFEMAEQIERNGASFYRKAADGAQDDDTRTFFEDLAGWEDKHVQIFAEMHAALADGERASQVFDPDEDGARYLQAFADRHVFDTRENPADRLSGNEDLEEILRMAIGLEKDSIVFYLGLREATPSVAGKERIESIIGEEMRHVAILSEELRKSLT